MYLSIPLPDLTISDCRLSVHCTWVSLAAVMYLSEYPVTELSIIRESCPDTQLLSPGRKFYSYDLPNLIIGVQINSVTIAYNRPQIGASMMELSTLESWLWKAACSIRGEVDAARYKDYILPLVFYKRLDDVYSDELDRLAKELAIPVEQVEALVEADRELIRFYIPEGARWDTVRLKTERLGERITDALKLIGRENKALETVIDRRDFNATDQGQRVLDDDSLTRLIEILSEHPLGLQDVEPDILGRAYEYLIRKFAERGSSAGEFFTPTAVGFLIAHILDPQPGETIYDPAAGSAGLLIKTELRFKEKLAESLGKSLSELVPDDNPNPIKLYGQELQADNVAAAKMNAFIHDMRAVVKQGNTMRSPQFVDDAGRLVRFDKITANPMWNQDISRQIYENDSFNRFSLGIPPQSSADWAWIQHMMSSLKVGGRMAVVLDTGAASRGSGNKGKNAERDIRKAYVDADMVEAVILLPQNLFFNTSAPGVIMVMRNVSADAPRDHSDEILLINASKLREKGNPKNFMTDDQIKQVADILLNWQEVEEISKAVNRAEVVRNDYNLSPSRYISHSDVEPPLPLEEAVVRLQEAEEARRQADEKLDQVMKVLGFGDWRDFNGSANDNGVS